MTTPQTQEPAPVDDGDAFANAFASLTTETPAEKPTEEAPAATATTEEAPAATTTEEAPAATEEAPAATEEAPAATEEAPAATEDDDDDKLLRRLARVIKKGDDEPAPARQPAQQPAQQEEAPPLLSADEQAFITEYEKDWPDVSRAEALKRRAEYAQVVGYVFKQVMSQVGPMQQMLQQLAEHAQVTQLQAAVPGYEDDREKVIAWVDKQPTYLQNAYQHVIRSGTVDEVTDLIARYRTETGQQAPSAAAPKPTAAAPAKKTEAELPTATKQAAASLAPVISKRSVVPAQEDPNDFASAFAKFDDLLK